MIHLSLIAAVALFSAASAGAWLPAKLRAGSPSAVSKALFFNTSPSGANVSSSLTNFPIAVHINPSSWPNASERVRLFDAYNAGGKRIRFYDSDETTVLPYEVEYFNAAAQEALYWVRVPQVDGNSTTDRILVHYGSDSFGSNQDDAAGVWSNGYVMVLHLGDNAWGASPEAKDSSASGYHGTDSATANATGIARQGRSFASAKVTLPSALDNPATIAFSVWARFSNSASSGLLAKAANTSSAQGWAFGLWSGAVGFLAQTTNYTSYREKIATVPHGDGAWHHLASDYTRATGAINVFADGSAVTTNSYGAGTAGFSTTNAQAITLGAVGSGDYFSGTLDELRVSTVIRSADWNRLEYFSVKKSNWNGDAWLSWGAETIR